MFINSSDTETQNVIQESVRKSDELPVTDVTDEASHSVSGAANKNTVETVTSEEIKHSDDAGGDETGFIRKTQSPGDLQQFYEIINKFKATTEQQLSEGTIASVCYGPKISYTAEKNSFYDNDEKENKHGDSNTATGATPRTATVTETKFCDAERSARNTIPADELPRGYETQTTGAPPGKVTSPGKNNAPGSNEVRSNVQSLLGSFDDVAKRNSCIAGTYLKTNYVFTDICETQNL